VPDVDRPFAKQLRDLGSTDTGRRWLYVPYDQLSDDIGPLSREAPGDVGIVLVESAAKATRRPYHKQKLALILSNMRSFALEQHERGVAVHYCAGDEDYATQLSAVAQTLGPLEVMRPAERELREELKPLVDDGRLQLLPHDGWLTTRQDFVEGTGEDPPWRMDRFYRHVRKLTGVLMEAGSPEGGRFSFDVDNRQPYRPDKGDPAPPALPVFGTSTIKEEVAALIKARFGEHPGTLDLYALPSTKDDAQQLWAWARDQCLPLFGPFEDAMSQAHSNLWHTRLSSVMNLHRVLPKTVVQDVATLDAPIASREGFIRQVLGWREFVHHVHEATDGFRRLPGELENDDGAPSFLEANTPLPAAFWPGVPSGLHCLDRVVEDVWREGYSHHITRLMVLSNIATLMGVSPRALTDWFWVAYTDAFDWVVEPNVLGMGTFAAGDVMTTKPYVSGAAYLHKMSDYCAGCAFSPKPSAKNACPITAMYWAFLDDNQRRLQDNQRIKLPLASCRKRSAEQRDDDHRVRDRVRELLGDGEALTPAKLAAPDAA
jgi:deoxyribodipyrimidine photolyase-related protein